MTTSEMKISNNSSVFQSQELSDFLSENNVSVLKKYLSDMHSERVSDNSSQEHESSHKNKDKLSSMINLLEILERINSPQINLEDFISWIPSDSLIREIDQWYGIDSCLKQIRRIEHVFAVYLLRDTDQCGPFLDEADDLKMLNHLGEMIFEAGEKLKPNEDDPREILKKARQILKQ